MRRTVKNKLTWTLSFCFIRRISEQGPDVQVDVPSIRTRALPDQSPTKQTSVGNPAKRGRTTGCWSSVSFHLQMVIILVCFKALGMNTEFNLKTSNSRLERIWECPQKLVLDFLTIEFLYTLEITKNKGRFYIFRKEYSSS
jgi:hypothetical protein